MEIFIPITLFVCIAAVAILRPISTRLGHLLEVMSRERLAAVSSAAAQPGDSPRMRILLESLSQRMDLIEERLDFTERLLGGPRRQSHAYRDEFTRAAQDVLQP